MTIIINQEINQYNNKYINSNIQLWINESTEDTTKKVAQGLGSLYITKSRDGACVYVHA